MRLTRQFFAESFMVVVRKDADYLRDAIGKLESFKKQWPTDYKNRCGYASLSDAVVKAANHLLMEDGGAA